MGVINRNSNARVLVVDDVKSSRDVVCNILHRNGFEKINEASNGREALEMVVDVRPDMVVSDLMMPEMDGYDFCRAMRKNPKFVDTPIIVQTAVEQADQRMLAFDAGATDLLVKPINPQELIVRLSLHLERHTLLHELREFRDQTERELTSAFQVQRALLPSDAELRQLENEMPVRVSASFEPSYKLSGDLFGIKKLSPCKLAFYLLDFAGHGILASLNTFRMHAIMNAHVMPMENPGEYLTRLNAFVYPMLKRHEFATLFYAVVDWERNVLDYASAASCSPLVFSHGKLYPSVLDSSGMPIGVKEGATYRTKSIPFAKGDTIFAYSDALIENPANIEKAGKSGLLSLCHDYLLNHGSNLLHSPGYFQEWMLRQYYAYQERCHDDMTLLLISRL